MALHFFGKFWRGVLERMDNFHVFIILPHFIEASKAEIIAILTAEAYLYISSFINDNNLNENPWHINSNVLTSLTFWMHNVDQQWDSFHNDHIALHCGMFEMSSWKALWFSSIHY